jgi:molybdopterin-guanine dinucleotide biosynthesis protein B
MNETRYLPPIVSVVGKSDTGKTTLMVKLIAELKRRGYRVATIKHDVHGFDIDTPGKDSWRHAVAGSDVVFIASPQKLAMVRRLDSEWPIDEIASMCVDVDIVLTEGYKREDKPKIEVSRKAKGIELLCDSKDLVAIAADQLFELDVPQFHLDDVEGLVDLLVESILQTRPSSHSHYSQNTIPPNSIS